MVKVSTMILIALTAIVSCQNEDWNGSSTNETKVKFLVFDIDQCLYPTNVSIKKLVDEGFKNVRSEIPSMNPISRSGKYRSSYKKHIEEKNLSEKDVAKIFDQLDFTSTIEEDLKLQDLLKTAKHQNYRLICFTNSYILQGEKCLRALGIEPDFFEKIFFYDYMLEDDAGLRKPDLEAYRQVQNYMGKSDLTEVHFFDNERRNLQPASRFFDWNTYHVSIEEDINSHLSGLLGNQ